MGETSLRWRGRIGSLKGAALLVVIMGGLGLALSASNLATARSNPSDPEVVTMRQLAEGLVGKDRYVAVAGFAEYEPVYVETEDGRTTALFYFLYDDEEGYVLTVKADSLNLDGRVDSMVTLTGMTWTMTSNLRPLVEADADDWAEHGRVLGTTYYLREGMTPPDEQGALVASIGLGFAVLLGNPVADAGMEDLTGVTLAAFLTRLWRRRFVVATLLMDTDLQGLLTGCSAHDRISLSGQIEPHQFQDIFFIIND